MLKISQICFDWLSCGAMPHYEKDQATSILEYNLDTLTWEPVGIGLHRYLFTLKSFHITEDFDTLFKLALSSLRKIKFNSQEKGVLLVPWREGDPLIGFDQESSIALGMGFFPDAYLDEEYCIIPNEKWIPYYIKLLS